MDFPPPDAPLSISNCELERIDDFYAAIVEVENIPGRHREMITPSDCGNLAISYAHRRAINSLLKTEGVERVV